MNCNEALLTKRSKFWKEYFKQNKQTLTKLCLQNVHIFGKDNSKAKQLNFKGVWLEKLAYLCSKTDTFSTTYLQANNTNNSNLIENAETTDPCLETITQFGVRIIMNLKSMLFGRVQRFHFASVPKSRQILF